MSRIKLPVLGIDNAGKTSLITTLQREFEELTKMKPTRKIERTKLQFFDKKLVVWDFGGQKKYRKKYKKKADSYFSDIGGEAFYVVDIQDEESFKESLSYFEDILDAIKEYSPDTTVNLLINKLDPGMEQKNHIHGRFQKLSEEFIARVTPLKMRISQTSIFNPISVIRAFSKPIFGNTTLYDNFSILFKDFVDESEALFGLIFTDELLEIGNYFSEKINQNQMKELAQKIFDSYNGTSFNLAELVLPKSDLTLEILEFQPKEQKLFFTYGFPKDIQDKNVLTTKAFNLLNDVKKLMKFI